MTSLSRGGVSLLKVLHLLLAEPVLVADRFVLLWPGDRPVERDTGVVALQAGAVLTGLPFAMVLLLICYSLHKGLSEEWRNMRGGGSEPEYLWQKGRLSRFNQRKDDDNNLMTDAFPVQGQASLLFNAALAGTCQNQPAGQAPARF